MVVVGHLFSFLQKVSGAGVIRTNHTCPCLELSISRKLYPDFFVLEEKYEEPDFYSFPYKTNVIDP